MEDKGESSIDLSERIPSNLWLLTSVEDCFCAVPLFAPHKINVDDVLVPLGLNRWRYRSTLSVA
jgi:hypothetical protein